MTEQSSRSERAVEGLLRRGRRAAKGLLLGLLAGYVVGIVWWCCLAMAFGPSIAITQDVRGYHEEEITVLDRMVYAPLVAIPWAVVGCIAGLVLGGVGDWIGIAITGLGTIGGMCYALATNPFDGRLTLSMPIDSIVGTFAGLGVGGLVAMAITFSTASSYPLTMVRSSNAS